jgi:hypothetical protein
MALFHAIRNNQTSFAILTQEMLDRFAQQYLCADGYFRSTIGPPYELAIR